MSDAVGRIEQLTTGAVPVVPPPVPTAPAAEASSVQSEAGEPRREDGGMDDSRRPAGEGDGFASLEDLTGGDEEEPATVEATLENGKKIRVFVLRDAWEILRVRKKVDEYVDVAVRNPPDAWKPYLPTGTDILRMATFVEKCLVHPKMSFRDCLKMAKRRGMEFMELAGTVMAKAGFEAAQAEVEAIDDAGNA